MRNLYLLLIFLLACTPNSNNGKANESITNKRRTIPELSLLQAEKLVRLPLHGIDTEYPNKLGQVLTADTDLKTPKELHPAFYGCFDWHSAVHGHWSLVKLLKEFPGLKESETIEYALLEHLSKENILTEVKYFKLEQESSFERTYGWAWLLKLAEELHTWDSPLARKLEVNLQPLTNLVVERFETFLPKLHYPIRVGTHVNTAFGMSFALDYANTVANSELKTVIVNRAKDYFLNDENGPLSWEPNGTDFLSPCFEEVDIMRKALSKEEFAKWLKQFLPQLSNPAFTLQLGVVSDRKDGHLVHLDGLNFSRAWCLYGIAHTLPEYQHLLPIADKHIQYSLPNVIGDSYEGSHWLGTFAIYALNASK
ncbi:DUF2891 domain-containing protein [Ancylomarina longa]|uniref:DUF2891 domain-containing protein n=1 Tax=Ancylomarina longa TaxID=2487017 RepID=A0A434AGF3_9BACT|nr:DUF2891 domain-containing protein [Ancylomarina longa]RUT73468.1 DUF2891 domain-containing protein [Ancylomarina longa]